MKKIQLSIVFPAFNEEERIGQSLNLTREYCAANFTDYEVIVADDGSNDDTAKIVTEMMGQWTNLRLVKLPQNRGKGAATRHGVLAAKLEWVLCSDVDLSTPIQDVEKLLAHVDTVPIVIGSRAIEGSHIARRQPWYRVLMGRVFNMFVRLIGVPGYRDTQCGFKMYRRDAGRAIFEKTTVDGFAFDVEVLLLAHKLGLPVVEVPVVWLNDEHSKVHVFSDPPKMFLDLIKVRWRHRKLRTSEEYLQ